MKVEFDTTGFSIAGARVPWSVVQEVFAYKEDLLAELPLHFPGIRTDWFGDVAFPAFVTIRTTLRGAPFPG